jgi:hypothetical protein
MHIGRQNGTARNCLLTPVNLQAKAIKGRKSCDASNVSTEDIFQQANEKVLTR